MTDQSAETVGTPAAERDRAERWIPVGERLPKVHDDVLIVSLESSQPVFGYLEGDGEWYIYTNAYINGEGYIGPEFVTHWRPLPVPPIDHQ